MIIEANTLAYDLRGVSIFERILYVFIFTLGVFIIRTGSAFNQCDETIDDGLQWELGFVPLALLADVTKSYNLTLLIVGLFQMIICRLHLKLIITYVIYKILGEHKLIYSLLYIIPLVIESFLPYYKWIFIYIQFILVLLIIMLNKSLQMTKANKKAFNLKYYISRVLIVIYLFQKLDMIYEYLLWEQLLLLVFCIPIVHILYDKLPEYIFGLLYCLLIFTIYINAIFWMLILQCLLVCYVTIGLLPSLMDTKIAITTALMIPIIGQTFIIPDYGIVLLFGLFIKQPQYTFYEQIEL